MKYKLNSHIPYTIILLITVLLFASSKANAQKAEKTRETTPHLVYDKNCGVPFDALDAEIGKWPEYEAKRQQKADSLAQIFRTETVREKWYKACEELVDVYDGFQNDSALYFLEKLYGTALWIPDSSYVNMCRIKYAKLCTNAGLYNSSLTFLDQVDTTTLDRKGMIEYYKTMQSVYVEMTNVSCLWFKTQEYKEKQHICRLHLFSLYDKDNPELYLCEAYDLLMQDRHKEAYAKAMQCLKIADPMSFAYCRMTFHLRVISEALKHWDESNYWLAISAITELRLGLRDQVGLWSLASRMDENEIEKSYEYLRFSWDVNAKGGTKVSTRNLLPVMGTLTGEHDSRIETLTRRQSVMIGCLAVLAVIFIALFVYANTQRKRVSIARNELSKTNVQLEQTNHELERTNKDLKLSNTKLADANRVMEHYIISFFDICVGYVNQMEEYRNHDSMLLRKGKVQDVMKNMTSPNFTQKELNRLYDHFDEVFLGLYPTFIEDFNALLNEESRITAAHKSKLNTPLRIFALLRLGIDRPNDVAKFLHCSSTTIYNYRTQFKNAYIGERDEFEEAVRRIGLEAQN